MGEKEKKYDRQLRLWGDHGQRELESALVCLINVTATGTEILKNLILPGIGSFTIVDGSRITGEDCGNNFFLDPDSIGESKAKVATQMLQELNPDVKGEFMEEDIEQLLDRNPQLLTKFSVVILANPLVEDTLLKISDLLWKNDIPLLLSVSYGFIGYLRVAVQEHCIIESHPDNAHDDLRLDDPLPAFCDYADQIDLDQLDKKDHAHTPYLIILYKYLQMWKQRNDGAVPRSWKEKKAFKQFLLSGVRKNADGVPETEENFDEAAKHVNTALTPSGVPDNIRDIFDDPKCNVITDSSSGFWLMANALKQFVANEGARRLPLRGDLPDMTSDSERYVKLQDIYQARARHDAEVVTSYIAQSCLDIGCGNGKVSERDVKRFCRNAHFLRLVRTRSINDEYTSPSKTILEEFTNGSNPNVLWYVMFRAVQLFHTAHGRFPGNSEDDLELDKGRLKNCLKELLRSWGIPGASEAVSDDYITEICRCGAAEIHSVAAYLGGVAAQEAIKLLTGQYVPIANAHIYNALKSTSVTLEV